MKKDKHPVEILIHKFTKTFGLPFQEVLPSSIIEQVLIDIGLKYKNRIYNPIVIVWSFLSQVLDADHSCKNAVSKIIAHLAEKDLKTPSQNTSAYCQARKNLPELLFKKLLDISSKNLENIVDKKHLWRQMFLFFIKYPFTISYLRRDIIRSYKRGTL
ncbi:MAG: hypothetical protein QNJ54_34970 [Prochloraceae cyanobacterium]|nr:hypothetical protein [Prochloraceae cyanobacterium]